jgi:hypothetical protein
LVDYRRLAAKSPIGVREVLDGVCARLETALLWGEYDMPDYDEQNEGAK